MTSIKALGIDYGDARIGVAASDDLGMMAHPVETIDARDNRIRPTARIAEIATERKVTHVVVGMPLRMDGSEGTAAEKVRKFIAALKKDLPENLVVEEIDERLSTVEAQRQLHLSGKNTKKSKPVIDQAAAVVILQDWLDNRAGFDSQLIDDFDPHDRD